MPFVPGDLAEVQSGPACKSKRNGPSGVFRRSPWLGYLRSVLLSRCVIRTLLMTTGIETQRMSPRAICCG